MFTYVTGVNRNLTRVAFQESTGKVQQSLILYIYLQADLTVCKTNPIRDHTLILGELIVVPEEEQTDEANKKYKISIFFYAAVLFSLVERIGIKARRGE